MLSIYKIFRLDLGKQLKKIMHDIIQALRYVM